MTPRPTRRAFLGAGIAAAAGASVGRLPSALSGLHLSHEHLALDVPELSSAGRMPSFGTLRAQGNPGALEHGALHDRRSGAHRGTISITSVSGTRVHSIELAPGTIVAVGNDQDASFAVASGTGAYAKARGKVTVRNAAHAALALDIELEL
jgi:hypothetical protein